MTLHFSPLLLNRYFSNSSSLHCVGLLQKRNSLETVWAIDRLYKPGVTDSYLGEKHKAWEKITSPLFTIEHGEEVIRQIPFLNLILWCLSSISQPRTYFFPPCHPVHSAHLLPSVLSLARGCTAGWTLELLGSIRQSGNFIFKLSSFELQTL